MGCFFRHGGLGIFFSTALFTARVRALAIAWANALRFDADVANSWSYTLRHTRGWADRDAGLPDNFHAWGGANGHIAGTGWHAHLALGNTSLSADGRWATRLFALLVWKRHCPFLKRKTNLWKRNRRNVNPGWDTLKGSQTLVKVE